ncbi:uncharacterized protein [Aegilops tauschii subsp. strangulata]|uniref:uncharacterized protein n=1 Tax=Aegilops tauschii subsp. strangulata TaxID=200361 RepID=UPI003CC85780
MDLEGISSVHAMLDYLWGLDEKKRMHVLTFWWLWWSNRNKWELPLSGEEIARRTRTNVLEYIQILGPQPERKLVDKWIPPADDMVKINIDGSFLPGTNRAGWGVVARTSEGTIIRARAGCQENVSDPFAAEAYAMTQVVSLAADIGLIRVEFQTDSQLLLEALDMQKADSSARSANSVAHELASFGRLYDPNLYVEWEDDVPARVAECAMGDLPKHR